MDATVVVSLLIEKLQGLLLLPAKEAATSNQLSHKQVQEAINSLDSLKLFLKDVDDLEALSGQSSMNDQTVTQLLSAVYSADDALNTLILRKEFLEISSNEPSLISQLKRTFKNLKSREGILEKFENELRGLVEMKEKAVTSDTRLLSFGNGGGSHSSNLLQDRWGRISTADFCLEEETDVDLLINESLMRLAPYQFPKGIVVVGEGGSGKTTLATTLYDRVDVKRYFTNRAWVLVPSLFNARHVLADILRQINQAELLVVEATLSEDELMWKILKLLHGTRCLIVLEDVETSQILETVVNPICNSSQFDARIIITTSNANNLTPLQAGYLALNLVRLNKEESWKLFLKKVRMAEDEVMSNSELIRLKEKILEICGGLPARIVLLGGLLSTKERSYNEWSRVVLVRAGNNQGDIMALSYQDLPPELKPCFLYMGLFPKKFEIPMRRLIKLWVTEGFVMPQDMAERFFEELVIRNMIQVRRKLDGSPKICYMPGVLYDFFSLKAETAGFFNRQFQYSSCTSMKQSKLAVWRLAAFWRIKNLNSLSFVDVQNLRSFVAFDTRIRCTPSREISTFLKKIISNRGFGFLYVLDLEGVYKPMLTDDVMRKLIHLKYIGLRSTFIDSLPDCVPSLPCLETLDLKHTNISNVIHIDRAEKLQHLYLFVDYSDKVLLDLTSLTNLHTLWGIYFASETELSALQKLTTLTKLKLSCPANVFATNQTAECISHLTNLQSLKLKSVESAADDDHYINMGTLENHQKLQDLNLQGRLSNEMFVIGLFPPYLRKLTLSETRLSEDPMPLLGKLPHLNILCLLSNSSTSSKFTCLSREFPKLRLLKLWCIQDLEEWIVEEGAVSCLKELEIRCCKKLKAPQGLQYLTTLKELSITNMSEGKFGKALIEQIQQQVTNVSIKKSTCDFSLLEVEFKIRKKSEKASSTVDHYDDESDDHVKISVEVEDSSPLSEIRQQLESIATSRPKKRHLYA
ncbi:hypothetical protein LWI29_020771 [Acer saccharum]|uniref:Uncharacterized protein n=1 Tax=Acer saccharum TaxID=4024 RepID=A0AA39SUS9_ACESA|nr:hypothetical protein LWI29_020771 [Acer saccharum]